MLILQVADKVRDPDLSETDAVCYTNGVEGLHCVCSSSVSCRCRGPASLRTVMTHTSEDKDGGGPEASRARGQDRYAKCPSQ